MILGSVRAFAETLQRENVSDTLCSPLPPPQAFANLSVVAVNVSP